jgi:mRNA interferase MazF
MGGQIEALRPRDGSHDSNCNPFEALGGMTTNTEKPRNPGSTRICRGDVFWIPPDDTRGPAPSYSHPHVVVQDDIFNHSRITTVVVCALTSNLRRASEPGNILLEPGEGDLPSRSVVVVSQISSIDKVRLGQRIGSLSDARVDQILAGLRFQQVSFFER